MGDAHFVLENSLFIHNNCEMTYESEPQTSAVDVTVSKGINSYGEIKWRLIPDKLQTPHKGIIIDVGPAKVDNKRKIIDWEKFEWKQYEKIPKFH